MTETYDFVIAGGGIVGLTLARELRLRRPKARIAIIEKEAEFGSHGSTRNSGVIHAGIYYEPGTVKARLAVEGAALFREHCRERGLPIALSGKVIVARDETQVPLLKDLVRRARANGVTIEEAGAKRLQEIEPEVSSAAASGIISPNTAIVDPKAVVKDLVATLRASDVALLASTRVLGAEPAANLLKTSQGNLSYGYFINAAGSFADRLAWPFEIGRHYRMLPFRGSYYELAPASKIEIRGNIYPVPDSRVPFLGVHFTRSLHGKVYVGPTALPAFGREHYSSYHGIEWPAIVPRLSILARQYLANRGGFRELVHQELNRLAPAWFYEEARQLVPRLKREDLIPSKKVGIRAQLYDLKKQALEMDFIVEPGKDSVHVLNAVSPAFTCSFRMARHICDGSKL